MKTRFRAPPRGAVCLSDHEVVATERQRARRADEAQETYRGTGYLPVWEVAMLNPCDWRSLLRTSAEAATAEEAVAKALSRHPGVTRREVVRVARCPLPHHLRNPLGRQAVAPCPAGAEPP